MAQLILIYLMSDKNYCNWLIRKKIVGKGNFKENWNKKDNILKSNGGISKKLHFIESWNINKQKYLQIETANITHRFKCINYSYI